MTEDVTKLVETLSLGKRLLKEFGLDDWTFDLSQTRRIFGYCDFDTKKIEVSIYFLNQDMAEIEDTIRHEIAHALVGPKHDHDAVWKWKCIEVGAKPVRCYDEGITGTAKPNYIIECKGCGKRWERFRLRRKTYARAVSSCCGTGFNFYKAKKGE